MTKEINITPSPVHFGRWLLKNATPVFYDGQFLAYQYDNKTFDTAEIYEIFLQEFKRTNKTEKKVVLLQIDKKFLDEEFEHVEEALEEAKSAFQTHEGMRQAKAYVATVIEGYVQRDGVLSLEKVYIDLVEQKVIKNKPKTESKDAL